jgi:hypothetical protein
MNRFSLTRNDSKTERLWSSALGAKTCALQMPELAPLIRRVHGDVVLWVGDCQDAGAALEGCMIRHTIFAVQHQARWNGYWHRVGNCLFAALTLSAFMALDDYMPEFSPTP